MAGADDSEAELIINEIRAAFHDVSRGPLSLHQAMIAKYASPEQLADASKLDLDRHWSQIPDRYLEVGGRALYGYDPLSWRYFIPAFMAWSLRNFRINASFVSDQTIYGFDLPQDNQLRRSAMERFAMLSPAQCKAVCRFLQYMALNGIYADDVAAKRALHAHWGRYSDGEDA